MKADYFYGDSIGVNRTVIVENDKTRCFNIWNTCFAKQSLWEELAANGFASAVLYADVAGTPYTEESVTLCAVAKSARI